MKFLSPVNKVTITEPATGSTLTIANGATLSVSASATIGNGLHSGTNTGDQTSIVGIAGTKAQFDTACTDGNFAYISDLASYQPLDSDLAAIAALTTTSYGRALLSLADATAGRTSLGLGNQDTVSFGVVRVWDGPNTEYGSINLSDGEWFLQDGPSTGGALHGVVLSDNPMFNTIVPFVTPNAARASIRLNPGVAPTSPVDGDVWTTASGLFVRINGSTSAFSGTNSGTNTGDQTSIVGIIGTKAQFDTAVSDGNILYVGDVTSNATHTGDATGATALTLATVNATTGTFGGSSKMISSLTVNAKGLITAIAEGASTPAISNVTGLGTSVASALAIGVGSSGGPVTNGGALGTPSSGVATNLTGTASININGTVGATTPNTGSFTTLTASGVVTATKSFDIAIETITYGATMAIDSATSNKKYIVLAGNGTISDPTNPINGRTLLFKLRQDATGSRIPVWGSAYRFNGDLATVTLSTGANKIDRVAFEYDSTDSKWDCVSFIKGS